MIAWLLMNPLGRMISGGVAVLLFLGVFALDQRSRARSNLISDSKQEAQKINAKNAEVFNRSERPGAAERVRKRFCRDCE